MSQTDEFFNELPKLNISLEIIIFPIICRIFRENEGRSEIEGKHVVKELLKYYITEIDNIIKNKEPYNDLQAVFCSYFSKYYYEKYRYKFIKKQIIVEKFIN